MNSSKKKKFSFPLVFDPLRLALAVVRNSIGVILGGTLVAALAAAIGFTMFEDSYSVNFQMLGQDKQWGADGAGLKKAFEPLILNDDTLVDAATNLSVLEAAGSSLNPPLTGHQLSFMTKIDTNEGGELFDLTMKTTLGADQTVAAGRAWAQAIADHTADLRKHDALAKIEEYEIKLAENEAALKKLDEEIMGSSEESGSVDSELRITQVQAEIDATRKLLTEAKIVLDSTKDQVALFEREAKGPNFLRNLITLRQKDLEKYRLQNTEIHPLVQTALKDIELLTTELAKAERGEEFAIDGLSAEAQISGDAEFQKQAVLAKSNLASMERRVTNYSAQMEALNKEMAELRKSEVGEKGLREALSDRIATTALIKQRIKEAGFVATNPLPQVSMFMQGPTIGEVERSGKIKKVALAGFAGMLLGAGLVALRSMLKELRSDRLRTPVQVALATGIYPTLRYPRKDDRGASVVREFWLTDLASDLAVKRRFLFPVLDSVPGEKAFWEELVETVAQDGCQVVYMDFSYDPLTLSFHGQPLPFYNPMAPVQASCAHPFLTHSTNLLDALNQLPTEAVVIGRWGAPPVAWINQIRTFFDAVVIVTSAQTASRSEVEKNSRIYQQVLGDVHDTILVEDQPAGPLLQMVQAIEDSFVGSQRGEDGNGLHMGMDGGVMVYTPTTHQLENNPTKNRYPADPGIHAR